jgi:hypothetical protein
MNQFLDVLDATDKDIAIGNSEPNRIPRDGHLKLPWSKHDTPDIKMAVEVHLFEEISKLVGDLGRWVTR